MWQLMVLAALVTLVAHCVVGAANVRHRWSYTGFLHFSSQTEDKWRHVQALAERVRYVSFIAFGILLGLMFLSLLSG